MVKSNKRGGSKRSRRISNHPWFRALNDEVSWGFIPINWKGWVALLLLLAVNIFAANYFNLMVLNLDNYLKMGVVFLLSIFVFSEIAMRKTRGVLPPKLVVSNSNIKKSKSSKGRRRGGIKKNDKKG